MDALTLRSAVRDLTPADVATCDWAGSGIRDGLARAARGEADYLAVCPPAGRPVATGGVDWVEHSGAGTLFQLHVHEVLRGSGLGTLLVQEAERRTRARGLDRAELGVDVRDQRPRRLYERLGYEVYGEEPGGWDQELPDGTTTRYETTIILMRHDLRPVQSGHRGTARE